MDEVDVIGLLRMMCNPNDDDQIIIPHPDSGALDSILVHDRFVGDLTLRCKFLSELFLIWRPSWGIRSLTTWAVVRPLAVNVPAAMYLSTFLNYREFVAAVGVAPASFSSHTLRFTFPDDIILPIIDSSAGNSIRISSTLDESIDSDLGKTSSNDISMNIIPMAARVVTGKLLVRGHSVSATQQAITGTVMASRFPSAGSVWYPGIVRRFLGYPQNTKDFVVTSLVDGVACTVGPDVDHCLFNGYPNTHSLPDTVSVIFTGVFSGDDSNMLKNNVVAWRDIKIPDVNTGADGDGELHSSYGACMQIWNRWFGFGGVTLDDTTPNNTGAGNPPFIGLRSSAINTPTEWFNSTRLQFAIEYDICTSYAEAGKEPFHVCNMNHVYAYQLVPTAAGTTLYGFDTVRESFSGVVRDFHDWGNGSNSNAPALSIAHISTHKKADNTPDANPIRPIGQTFTRFKWVSDLHHIVPIDFEHSSRVPSGGSRMVNPVGNRTASSSSSVGNQTVYGVYIGTFIDIVAYQFGADDTHHVPGCYVDIAGLPPTPTPIDIESNVYGSVSVQIRAFATADFSLAQPVHVVQVTKSAGAETSIIVSSNVVREVAVPRSIGREAMVSSTAAIPRIISDQSLAFVRRMYNMLGVPFKRVWTIPQLTKMYETVCSFVDSLDEFVSLVGNATLVAEYNRYRGIKKLKAADVTNHMRK